MTIKSNELAAVLRDRSVDLNSRTFRMTKFEGSDQAEDLSMPPNSNGFGRIHHFRYESDPRWVGNPLPTYPVCAYHGRPFVDVLQAQVFQLGACDFRCWYCFVDFKLLAANPKFTQMVTAEQLLTWMLDSGSPSQVIDISGGQPEIVPEYALWMLEAREALGLTSTHFVWADDNLSNDYFWRYLSDHQIAWMLQQPGYARVGCLKGFDATSFSFNTAADPALFGQQITLLSRMVKAGFDQYGYITLTSPSLDDMADHMARLFDSLQERVHPNFPLRVVPLRIFGYKANERRIDPAAVENQFHALDAWNTELDRRFTASQRTTPIHLIPLGG